MTCVIKQIQLVSTLVQTNSGDLMSGKLITNDSLIKLETELHTYNMVMQHSESPPPVSDENKGPEAPEPSGDSQNEWVPGGEDTIATEAPADYPSAAAPDDAARSPLKRLLKDTPNRNSCNIKKKSRSIYNSPTHIENTEYASDGEPLIDFDSDVYNNVLVMPESAKESGWNCKTGGVKCPSCHRFFANRYNLKVHIRDKHDTREGTLQCDICQKRMRNPSCLRVHMYHHRKQAAYLAQLATQHQHQDQMRHVVQKMVGNNWRSDSPIAKADHKDSGNLSPPTPTPTPTPTATQAVPSDAADYDVDSVGAAVAEAEASLPKREPSAETV